MDYARLRLKYHGDPAALDEVLQTECRDKCARKLPTLAATPGFRFPSTALAEMSTSEAVAEIHASMVSPGERVLDMTFGLGIDAFAMSRRGAVVTGIELDGNARETGVHNARILGLDNISIVHADSLEWLDNNDCTFDTIFIDPQRRDTSGRHFSLARCLPDITSAMPLLRSRARRIIVKMSPMADPSAAKAELGIDRCRTIIIGTAKECKEVVMVVDSDYAPDLVECVTTGRPTLRFAPGESIQTQTFGYAVPKPGSTLLEPYPAVMKGASLGALNHIQAGKLAPNTHLFIADENHPDARQYCKTMEIKEILPFSKPIIKSFSKSHPVINVATRNFPLSAPELARRLKIREGGDLMVHGVTLADGSKTLLLTTLPR